MRVKIIKNDQLQGGNVDISGFIGQVFDARPYYKKNIEVNFTKEFGGNYIVYEGEYEIVEE